MKRSWIVFLVLFLTFSSFSKTTDVSKKSDIYVKYSKADITGLYGYELASEIEKEIFCDLVIVDDEDSDEEPFCTYNEPCDFMNPYTCDTSHQDCDCMSGGCTCDFFLQLCLRV